MGLDIYVGTLTRYYTRDWETIVQRMGREQGIQVQMIHAGDPPKPNAFQRLLIKLGLKPKPEEPMDKDEVRSVVETWQGNLINAVAVNGVQVHQWPESDDLPYFTDKPDWSGLYALIAWAVHVEQPGLEKPEQTPDVFNDEPYKQAMSASEDSQFRSLMMCAEFYVPSEKPFSVRAPGPNGDEVSLATTCGLHDDLIAVNEASWGVDASAIDAWRQNEPEPGVSAFEAEARFGWAVMMQLTRQAIEYKLPMKLDY